MTRAPFPEDPSTWALFLDFDGTLTELVDRPEDIQLAPGLPQTLAACEQTLDGAIALVSGRSIAQLDVFLHPLRLPSAGLHGLERRLLSDEVRTIEADTTALSRIRSSLEPMVEADSRLLLEDKGITVSLHYRLAPEREDECRDAMQTAIAATRGLEMLSGKMVFEAKPAGGNKGTAIADFLRSGPFHGRTPVFAGDDVTDEFGFQTVQSLGGIGIKVGPGDSCASHRCADVTTFLKWLHALANREAMRA